MKRAITLRPRLSEKAYGLSESDNTYVFNVSKDFNKLELAEAVASQYKVSVIAVRVANIPGKKVRSVRRKGRSVRNFQRSNIRKAYVTLKEGDKLPIFAAVEEASKKPDAKEKK